MATHWSVRVGVAALALGTLLATPGCIVISRKDSRTVALAEGRYTGAIRAAQSVSFSGDRTETYRTIAAKPDLEECDQQRLVYVLADDSGFSEDKTNVTLTLIKNPATTPGTKALIGKQVEDLAAFSDDRRKIAQALAD